MKGDVEMFCVIAKSAEILGVMFDRNIEDEKRWKKEELRGLNSSSGMVLYSVDELKGFDTFTNHYGFRMIRDKDDRVVGIEDSNGEKINENNMQFLDVSNYPELVNVLNKY
jgi:hypothetical protein